MNQIVHVSRLQKYLEPTSPKDEPEIPDSDEFDWEQEVEHLRGDNQPKGSVAEQSQPQDTQQNDRNEDMEEGSDVEQDLEYDVQAIVGARRVEGQLQYLVRWKGFSADKVAFHKRENTICNECGFRAVHANGMKKHLRRHKGK